MAEEIEELIVTQVNVGVATLDMSTDEEVVTDQVVVEEVTAADRRTGDERHLLLVYGADSVPAVADALRQAADRAAVVT